MYSLNARDHFNCSPLHFSWPAPRNRCGQTEGGGRRRADPGAQMRHLKAFFSAKHSGLFCNRIFLGDCGRHSVDPLGPCVFTSINTELTQDVTRGEDYTPPNAVFFCVGGGWATCDVMPLGVPSKLRDSPSADFFLHFPSGRWWVVIHFCTFKKNLPAYDLAALTRSTNLVQIRSRDAVGYAMLMSRPSLQSDLGTRTPKYTAFIMPTIDSYYTEILQMSVYYSLQPRAVLSSYSTLSL